MFATELGRIIDPGNFNRTFSRMVKRAGIEHISPHALRHSFATFCLQRGIDMKVLQTIMGHSSMSVTSDIYTHVLNERKIEEMKKLNDLISD